jgi:Ca2+/H+ antiporter, TMEM165/GDT1 family
MMLADVSAISPGNKFAQKVSMALVPGIEAVIFAILGLLALFNVGSAL